MVSPIDITGQRFGRLTALRPVRMSKRGRIWEVRCDCGQIREKLLTRLRTGDIRSCGCLRNEMSAETGRRVLTKHGLARSRAYKCWQMMMQRCYNPNDHNYKYYGARGITVHPDWHDPITFCQDMGQPPPKLSIERRNNDGDYERNNCYWATAKEQANNRRDIWANRRRSASGLTKSGQNHPKD